MGEKMGYIKTLSATAKDMGFTDINKFKSDFSDYIFVVSGQEMVDQQLIEQRIADYADPLSGSFQGRKKSSRKPSRNNIGLMRARSERRKQKLVKLRKEEEVLNKTYQKSGTDFDQLQHLTAQVKLREAEAGLAEMEKEISRLIQARIKELEASRDKTSDDESEE